MDNSSVSCYVAWENGRTGREGAQGELGARERAGKTVRDVVRLKEGKGYFFLWVCHCPFSSIFRAEVVGVELKLPEDRSG